MLKSVAVHGNISGIPALLEQCHLNAERLPDNDGYFMYQLLPER